MRIALTKSTLLVPPTYFAVAHAERMRDAYDWRMFTLAAEVTDPGMHVPVTELVPFHDRPFAQRERLIPLFMPAMVRAVVAWQPDVVHQHFATWSAPAVRAARRLDVPLVTTLHGADVFARLGTATSAMARWHDRNVDLVARAGTRTLAVSRYLADNAVRAGFDPARLQIHYQGVDTDLFTPAPDRAENERPIVLFTGALNEQKGIRDAVAASIRVARDHAHDFVVVGQGPLRAELERVAAEHPHIRLTGPTDRAGVRAWMQRADVQVVPSRTIDGRGESAGLVGLEAQACGTPVVATRCGGVPEMVDPQGGQLVDEGAVDQIADAITRVLIDPAGDRDERRRSAVDFVRRERSLAHSCEELGQIYREVTAAPAWSPARGSRPAPTAGA
ncbi:glycosyltransferase [Tersicoccus sp. Bi-70]|uniref:glycosyltransferase n=1 Tax=Tersicoccus sp. Bi-70 TaxID=1897634 RepID=UPI000978AD30|nr:glycosyltransferase [Tersicoccus sp. Bi-70]OMH35188.1 hypothetical protein BGP79_02480 [Tersicoccus sp. Bi-70]